MATKFHYWSGTCKYAMLKSPDTKFDPDGAYKIKLYPTDESWKDIVDSGIQTRKSHDEDGDFITIQRRVRQTIQNKSTIFGPPQVLDTNGKSVEEYVGNGSTVTCKVAVYDTRMGKGHRLEAVRVDHLIPYQKNAMPPADSPSAPSPAKAAAPQSMPF